jgi:hypothetical protein
MRSKLLLAALLLCAITPATAQVSIGIRSANVSIGINLPLFPQLVPVPGYPVYYAPDLNSNYFFYDGYYWVYQDDYWYESDWYNGPWYRVDPMYVPEFVLRIPVRYYRSPPRYFLSWQRDAAPRWDEHWGNSRSQRPVAGTSESRTAPRPYAGLSTATGDRYPPGGTATGTADQKLHYQPHQRSSDENNDSAARTRHGANTETLG